MHVYIEEFKNLGGYLVDVQRIPDRKGCYIKLKWVEKFILVVGAYEDRIFKKRAAIHESKLRRILSNIQVAEGQDEDDLFPVMRSAYDQKDPTTVFNTVLRCSSRSANHIFVTV